MLQATLFLAACLQPQEPASGHQEPAAPVLPWESQWRDGLRFEAADGRRGIRLGGRVHLDHAVVGNDPGLQAVAGPLADPTFFRRARFRLQGHEGEHLRWKMEVGLRGGSPRFLGTYLEVREAAGLPDLRAGYFREPFGLDAVTSGGDLAFLERSLPSELTPGRNLGLQASPDLGETFWFAGGLFQESSRGAVATGDGDLAWTGRFVWTPDRRTPTDDLVHLGASISWRNPPGDEVRFEGRPESQGVPALVDTGPVAAGSLLDLGLEAAWSRGPWTLQGEWIRARPRSPGAPDPVFQAWSLQAAWVLTGERRPYDAGRRRFERIRPESPFPGGTGAWEAALRWSRLDLEDAGPAGILEDWTLALNWTWTPALRILGDLILAEVEGVGRTEILQLRLALDF